MQYLHAVAFWLILFLPQFASEAPVSLAQPAQELSVYLPLFFLYAPVSLAQPLSSLVLDALVLNVVLYYDPDQLVTFDPQFVVIVLSSLARVLVFPRDKY